MDETPLELKKLIAGAVAELPLSAEEELPPVAVYDPLYHLRLASRELYDACKAHDYSKFVNTPRFPKTTL